MHANIEFYCLYSIQTISLHRSSCTLPNLFSVWYNDYSISSTSWKYYYTHGWPSGHSESSDWDKLIASFPYLVSVIAESDCVKHHCPSEFVWVGDPIQPEWHFTRCPNHPKYILNGKISESDAIFGDTVRLVSEWPWILFWSEKTRIGSDSTRLTLHRVSEPSRVIFE